MAFHILFLFVIVIPSVSFRTSTHESQNFTSNPNDLKALTGFSNCLESAIPDWNSSTSPDHCTWSGVTCDVLPGLGTRVVHLEQGSRRLAGKICESLAGSLPESIFQLQNLSTLYLQDNKLSGSLSKGVGNLSNLVEFDISNNDFYGVLPDIFESLTRLKVFSAESNGFIGQLPSTLVNSPSLQMLIMNDNSLSGSINLNCSAMKNLTSICLGSNQFHGPIPGSLSKCLRLEAIDLARNHLNGLVPVNFRNLQSLTQLSLSNSSLHNLSATLEILSQCRNLSTLVLTLNFHNEEMPQGQNLDFSNLKVFVLANSQIKGSIPKWLSRCKMLQLLDLSWNHLSGNIPSWIGNFDNLYYLDLSNNSFTGNIPQSLVKVLSLKQRNFSLEGIIFGFHLYTNGAWKGKSRMYKKVSSFRPSLILSYNKLKGPILPGFGNLKGLHVLDLKQNCLSGPIPHQLSGMTMLEILDLSQNKLTGEIPQSLVVLSFLSTFDVSYNQLHGIIPTGGQFDTFPSTSFEGNRGLYRSGTSGSMPSLPAKIPDHEEKLEIIGFPFGFGAVAGFLITTAAMCFATGWIFQ
ncbi:Leucine-rich repeat [Sesbania bispinosa]|nr:Leucine-rich repeat [Sesbania bispinosa]